MGFQPERSNLKSPSVHITRSQVDSVRSSSTMTLEEHDVGCQRSIACRTAWSTSRGLGTKRRLLSRDRSSATSAEQKPPSDAYQLRWTSAWPITSNDALTCNSSSGNTGHAILSHARATEVSSVAREDFQRMRRFPPAPTLR